MNKTEEILNLLTTIRKELSGINKRLANIEKRNSDKTPKTKKNKGGNAKAHQKNPKPVITAIDIPIG